MIAQLLAKQTIQHQRYAGPDSYSAPTYEAAIERLARVQFSDRLIPNIAGAMTLSTVQVFVDGVLGRIGPQDLLTLPDGTSPVIIRVDNVPSLDGATIDHCEVYC